jgi:hypothetical protein
LDQSVRVQRVNTDHLIMVVPNVSMEGKTLAIVMKYDIARELNKKLGQELTAWETVTEHNNQPRDMKAHIDPDNLDLNIGGH